MSWGSGVRAVLCGMSRSMQTLPPALFAPPLSPTPRYVIALIAAWSGEYAASAALAVVYIQEAHATDEWPINSARESRKGLHRRLLPQAAAAAVGNTDNRLDERMRFDDSNVNSTNDNNSSGGGSSSSSAPSAPAPFTIVAMNTGAAENDDDAPRRGGAPIAYAQHTSMAARLAAAADFVADYDVPLDRVCVVADDMSNIFQTVYAAWPIRWYVFTMGEGYAGGNVAASTAHPAAAAVAAATSAASATPTVLVSHIGEPNEASFDMMEVKLFLEEEAWRQQQRHQLQQL